MSNDSKKEIVIRCPKCECEYLPGEIYMSDYLVGKPRDVERTYDGKIFLYDGIEQNLEESFVCEKCGKPFKVKATMSFETTYDAEHDFSEAHTVPLYSGDRLHLEEN